MPTQRWWQALVLLLVVPALLAACKSEPPAVLLNASYDVTRELYAELNPLFVKESKQRTGRSVVIQQSHAGSSTQVRAVMEGLEADVVTMNQALDIDTIAKKTKLVAEGWAERLPNHSVPFTSTISFVVRAGNPKRIADWGDLVKPGVAPVIPNPKTSGNGRYSYLAAWAYALRRLGAEPAAMEYMKQLFAAVPVLDTGGRGASVTFTERGIGNVLLTFENEAKQIVARPGAAFAIVVPSLSVLAENPVAVVEKVAEKKGNLALAKAYLEFLFSKPAQEIGARHYFRPTHPDVLASRKAEFPELERISVAELGGWPALQAKHFVDGALFDQLYRKPIE